jgi:hypothetical protein
VPLNQMDPRIHARIEARLAEIDIELGDGDTSALMAEALYDERNDLLRMVAENDDTWNHVDFFDPEDNPSWPAPVARLNRDGDIMVMLPCTDCGLVDETTAGMNGLCAECFWESTKRQRRCCVSCGGHLSLVTETMCDLCIGVEEEEDTRGCGNCAGCAYCMTTADYEPSGEI